MNHFLPVRVRVRVCCLGIYEVLQERGDETKAVAVRPNTVKWWKFIAQTPKSTSKQPNTDPENVETFRGLTVEVEPTRPNILLSEIRSFKGVPLPTWDMFALTVSLVVIVWT